MPFDPLVFNAGNTGLALQRALYGTSSNFSFGTTLLAVAPHAATTRFTLGVAGKVAAVLWGQVFVLRETAAAPAARARSSLQGSVLAAAIMAVHEIDNTLGVLRETQGNPYWLVDQSNGGIQTVTWVTEDLSTGGTHTFHGAVTLASVADGAL